jgi:hypothetical protein
MSRAWCTQTAPLIALFALMAAPWAGAAEVRVISPQDGAGLSGTVEVIAQVVPPRAASLDRVVLVTADGRTIRMTPQFADRYTAALDTTTLRNGKQALAVIAFAKGRDEEMLTADTSKAWGSEVRSWEAEVRVAVSNPYNHYWGDLHAHTSYSDGCRVPEVAYRYARDTARLDFFAVTDHSQLLTLDEYADTVAQADRFNEPGRFVALYGVESTEGTGHLNVYMSPVPQLPVDLDARYRAIGEMELLGHFNHPSPFEHEGQPWRDDFEGFHWVPAADQCMAMVEVRSPEEEAAYIALLNAGWHVGAAGCQDQHGATWGTGGSTWTVALARELTREAILEALWSRRCYSAADRNLRLDFTLDGEDMGSRIARRGGQMSFLITVADPDPGEVVEQIDLFVDGKIAQTVRPGLTTYAWAASLDLPRGTHYCFARVTQVRDRMSWSSPIWVTVY